MTRQGRFPDIPVRSINATVPGVAEQAADRIRAAGRTPSYSGFQRSRRSSHSR
jgi:hypothetical protein